MAAPAALKQHFHEANTAAMTPAKASVHNVGHDPTGGLLY